MQIPVCNIERHGMLAGAVIFDTNTRKFLDINKISDRCLPVQDYLSCTVECNKRCTAIGKVYARGTYVICFGDNFAYECDRQVLMHYTVSNLKFGSDGRIICIDGRLPDLIDLFPDKKIKFVSSFSESQASSLGVSRKFYAYYDGMPCVVKFSKRTDNKDIFNEELVYNMACKLSVPCCRAITSKYFGKYCCISIYAYTARDVFRSFKTTGLSIKDIYNRLRDEDKVIFDRMMLFDFLVKQEDRHMSNLALLNGRMYPLFDNGECLGLGIVSIFSANFRKYILGMNKNYLCHLIDFNKVDRTNSTIRDSLKELGLCI